MRTKPWGKGGNENKEGKIRYTILSSPKTTNSKGARTKRLNTLLIHYY